MNKLSLAAVLITCLFLWQDWAARFGTEQGNADVSQGVLEVSALPDLTLTADQNDSLTEKLAPYLQEASSEDAAVQEGMSLEEQQKQNGLLTEVWVEDKKLTLKAVILETDLSNGQVALLDVNDMQQRLSTTEKVASGQVLYGYFFHIVNNKRVDLFRVASEDSSTSINRSEPDISLVMYKSQS